MSAQDRAIQKLARELAGIKKEVVSWRGPQADYTSIENGGNFTFKDGDGNVTAVVGGQDDGSNTIRHVDGPTPPIPSGLSAHVDGPIIQVSWDGSFEDSITHDWHYLEVLAVGPSNEQLTGTIDNADGGSTSLAATSQGDWVVVARSASRAGKRSLDGDAGTVAVQLVGLTGAIESVQTSADGKNTIYYSTTMPPGTDYVEGDLWFDTSEDGNNRASVWDGAEWLSVADGRVTDIAAAQDVLDANQEALDGRLDDAFGQIEDAIVSANGKNVVHYEADAPTAADPGVEGDTWFAGQVGRPDDVIEATNLATNPSFEIDTSAWEIRWTSGIEYIGRYDNAYLGVSVGDYCLGIKGTDTVKSGTGIIQTAPIAVSPGEWVNVAGSFRAQGSTPVAVRLRLYWLDSGGNEIGSSYLEPWRVVSDLDNSVPANRIVGSAPGQAPSGAVAFRLAVWYRDVNGSDAPPAGFVAYIDGVQVASASSEAGAKSAVATYFDGDTTDGETDDDPHYRWTGTPHASTSEKYLPATDGLSSNWNATGQYRHDGTGWVEVELSHHVISSADVGKLVAGSATIKEAVVQKLFAEVVVAKMVVADEFIGENAILTGAVTADKMAVGAITAESGIIESLDLGKATVGELDGIRIAAQTIRGQQLSGDAIDGKVITGGTYRTTGGTGSWSDAGLFIAQPDGTSMVRFPTDGSPLSLTASDVQIDRASITDLDLSYGAVRSGGQFTLASGVTAPASPPELTTGWSKFATLGASSDRDYPPHAWESLGYWSAGDAWVRSVNIFGASSSEPDKVEIFDYATGSFIRSFNIELNPTNNLTIIGDIVYLFGDVYPSSGVKSTWIYGYNLNTGARTSRHEYTRVVQAKNALGNDGTNLIIASVYNLELWVHRRDPVTGAQVGPDMRSGSNSWPSASDGRLYGVSIDGSDLTVVPAETARVYTIDGGTLTRKTDTANASGFAGWYNPNKNGAGMVWRDGLPYVVDGTGGVYKGSTFTTDATVQMCFTWTDGTHETTPSPLVTFQAGAREVFTVSLPQRTGLSKRLYYRSGTSGSWVMKGVPEGTTVYVVSDVAGLASTPPTVNSFPNADPATLKSTNDKFEVKGDGSGHWGNFKVNANGAMSGLIVSGQVAITPDSANTVKQVTVNLPAGRFSKPPVVWAQLNTSVPHWCSLGVYQPGDTNTFTMFLTRTNTTTTDVYWFAMDSE